MWPKIILIASFFLILTWPVGAQTCPVGYFKHGDFCCDSDTNFEKPDSAGLGVFSKKFCQPQITGCQATGGKFCTAGTRNACCPATSACGKGTIAGFEQAVCVPPTTSCTARSPGYAGRTKDGQNVCCQDNQEPGPLGRGTNTPYCQPKSRSVCVAGERFVQGAGNYKGEKRCCLVNTNPSLHPNGLPFCAYLPYLKVDYPNEDLAVNQAHKVTVSWQRHNLLDNLPATLSLRNANGSVPWSMTTVNDGGEIVDWSRVPAGRYQFVVVVDHENLIYRDASDEFFDLQDTRPKLTLVSPASGAVFPISQPLFVSWLSQDIPVGTDLTIDLLNDRNQGVVRTRQPLISTNSTLIPVPATVTPGKYTIKIYATVDGQTITDQSDNFFTLTGPPLPLPVSTTPGVSIISPTTNNQLVTGSFPLTATFSAPAGSYVKAGKLYVDNALVWTSPFRPASPLLRYLSTWRLPAGSHKIKFTVVDSNNQTASAERSINVIPDTTPPVVEITDPPNNATTLSISSNLVSISARAKDSNGISDFIICINNDCASVCQKTTGPNYASCRKSFMPSQFINQTVRVTAKAKDWAYKPNQGVDSVEFSIPLTIDTDSSGSGIVGLKPDSGIPKNILPSTPWCHTFNANLSIGMSGSEVSALQTALARAGLGGDRSDSYDEATASDVSGFQIKYRRELLTAHGLNYPTGYFGPATRRKMNELYGCGNAVTSPPPPPVSPSPLSQTPTSPLSALIAVFPSKYNSLLNNQKINAAIIKSGAFQAGEIEFLRDKVLELENSNTQTWDQFLHPQPFDEQEMRKMWLQQVALSLYVEANKIVPWSILSYENESLGLLLAYPTESYPLFDGLVSFSVFNHNPIIPYNYAKEITKLYPNARNTPSDFLYSLIMRMRNDGWIHASGDPYYEACDFSNRFPLTFDCVGKIKKGTSTHTPLFIKSVLMAYNIPSQLVRPYLGHGGIFFPTVSLAMDGDATYNGYLAGLRIRPNKIPVGNSFIDLNLVKTWLEMPVCQGSRLNARTEVLAYLALYNKPEWRKDLLASYNYNSNGSYSPGQWLKEGAISGTIPNSYCQNTDPTAPNYWTPILSESEWTFWLSKIASVVNQPSTATPALTVTSPANNSQWTIANGPVIVWSSANIPSGNTITVELLTPSNGSVPCSANFTTANDGSESGRLTNSNLPSGFYYFRLSTVVNGQTIYGGSGVFQFTGTPTTAATYTITASATAGGTISPSGAVTVNQGASQTFIITPSSGYRLSNVFVNGSTVGGISSAGYTFSNVQANQTISASFSLNPTTSYTLTTATDGTGSGTITKSPNQTNYAAGTVVTVTANPTVGSTFTGWSGGAVTGTNNPKSFSLDGNRNVIATFTANTSPPATPSLTVTSPTNNSQWTIANGPVIQWSSANIPASNQITVELLTPTGGSVPCSANFTTANDGSESGRLTGSCVVSGFYYFRLSTVVNGQTIYGGSGVFQFTGATTPPPTQPTISVTAPAANYIWVKSAAHPVNWTSVNIPATDNITIELFYQNNTLVPGSQFNNYITTNDGNRDVSLANVSAGLYWFRLSATVNGQIVYGGSQVFRVE